jgi:two-component system, OmpR family, sensor histidine kinase KdpD
MKKQTFVNSAGTVGIQSFLVLLILTGVTIITLILRGIGFAEINVVVVYVLSVLLVARFTKGYVYGIAASVLAIICYNFFFTEPYHTLNVYHMSDVITIAVMLAASFLTSTLTSKLLLATRLAKEREEQTNILFQITSSLAKASGVTDVAAASVLCLSNLLNTEVLCIVPSENDGKILFRASLGSGNVSIRDIGKEK